MFVDGRIRTEKNGGAWCPKAQISRDVYEWIQVDLGELKVVTQVETQGRFGNGQVRVPNTTIAPLHSDSHPVPDSITYIGQFVRGGCCRGSLVWGMSVRENEQTHG